MTSRLVVKDQDLLYIFQEGINTLSSEADFHEWCHLQTLVCKRCHSDLLLVNWMKVKFTVTNALSPLTIGLLKKGGTRTDGGNCLRVIWSPLTSSI